MRNKIKLFNLILIVVLIFSLTASCTSPKTAIQTTTAETTIIETTAPETTVPETTVAEKTAITSIDIEGYDKLSITFNSCLESDIAVEGSFTDGTFTCTAKPGMKFVIIFFEFKNNGNSEQQTPYIGSILSNDDEITTNNGDKYHMWSTGWAHNDKEYNRRESTKEEIDKLIGDPGGFEKLLPEESVKGSIVFEIPSNLIPTKLKLEIGDNLYDIEIPETSIIKESNTETTIHETTDTTMTYEEAFNNYKVALQDYLVKAFDAELTKCTINEDKTLVTVAFNTKWAVDETMKKELYDITRGLTKGDGWIFNADLELTSTSKRGDTLNTYMTYENMIKLQNLELSYEDWLKIAFK